MALTRDQINSTFQQKLGRPATDFEFSTYANAPLESLSNLDRTYGSLKPDASLTDFLKYTGADASMKARADLATKNGIPNYTGSADENTKLLKSLRTPATAPAASSATPGAPATPTGKQAPTDGTPAAPADQKPAAEVVPGAPADQKAPADATKIAPTDTTGAAASTATPKAASTPLAITGTPTPDEVKIPQGSEDYKAYSDTLSKINALDDQLDSAYQDAIKAAQGSGNPFVENQIKAMVAFQKQPLILQRNSLTRQLQAQQRQYQFDVTNQRYDRTSAQKIYAGTLSAIGNGSIDPKKLDPEYLSELETAAGAAPGSLLTATAKAGTTYTPRVTTDNNGNMYVVYTPKNPNAGLPVQATDITASTGIKGKTSLGASVLDSSAKDQLADAIIANGYTLPSGMSRGLTKADIAEGYNRAFDKAAQKGDTATMVIAKAKTLQANSQALTQVAKQKASAEAFESKALTQVNLVKGFSEQLSRSGSPLINSYLNGLKSGTFGSVDAQNLHNAIVTFATEYSKIMTGATGSAAGSTDSARAEAEGLINDAMTKGQVLSQLALMTSEMKASIAGYDTTMKGLQDSIAGVENTVGANAPKVKIGDQTYAAGTVLVNGDTKLIVNADGTLSGTDGKTYDAQGNEIQ